VDTSVLVAIAFDEPDAAPATSAIRALDAVFSSHLTETELLAAAKREGLEAGIEVLLRPIRWIRPNRRLTAEARAVLEHSDSLSGNELHHLATGLFVFPDPGEAFFLTFAREQRRVARSLGFVNLL